jgi:hypothetical protein
METKTPYSKRIDVQGEVYMKEKQVSTLLFISDKIRHKKCPF